MIRSGTKPGRAWSTWDRALALALTLYEDSLCPCCGVPKSTAWNDDTEGAWSVNDDLICHAGAAREQWRKDDAGNAEPGTLPRVVNTLGRDPDPLMMQR